MKKLMWAGAVALVMVGGSAALAADLSMREAPVPMAGAAPIISWTGLYAGAVGSYGWGNTTAAFSAPSFLTTWGAVNIPLDGGLLGATLGYNFDLNNNFVLGIEGDISAGRIGGNAFLPRNTGTPFNPNDTLGAFHQSYFGTLRARLGLSTTSMGNPTLWYLTGGLAFSDGHREISNTSVGDSLASANHTGWTFGAGIEHKITNHWSVKGEVLYADLGTQHYQSSTSTVVTDVHLTDTLLRVGVNYGF